MKIAISCGGTGGHVFPGIAVAEELEKRAHEVVLWLGGKNIEGASAAGWKGRTVLVRSEGLSGSGLRAPLAAFRMAAAVLASRRLMRRDRPDALLAMGGYTSVGPVLGARLSGVPAVLHEANLVPGRAVDFLSRFAGAVAVSFEETVPMVRRSVLTGFPVRGNIDRSAPRDYSRGGPPGLLVMGGSQGARVLNSIVVDTLVELRGRGFDLKALHLAGPRDAESVKARYAAAGLAHEVCAFRSDMPAVYASVDFAVCRSGAATCAELSMTALPALLVPYPAAVRDHQTANADALVRAGQADLIPERELDGGRLAGYLERTLRDLDRLRAMSRSAAARTAGSAPAVAIADLIEKTAAAGTQAG